MDENKNKTLDTENEETAASPEDELKEELEEVASLLQSELNQLKEENKNGKIKDWDNLVEVETTLPTNIELVSENDDTKTQKSKDNETTGDDNQPLCDHCNENVAQEDSRFCKSCEKATLRVPMNWLGILICLFTIVALGFGIYSLKENAVPFISAMKADSYQNKKEYSSAVEGYLSLAQDGNTGYYIALRTVNALEATGSVGSTETLLSSTFKLNTASLDSPQMLVFKKAMLRERKIISTSDDFNAFLSEFIKENQMDLSAEEYEKTTAKIAEMKKDTEKYEPAYLDYLQISMASFAGKSVDERLTMITEDNLKTFPWLYLPLYANLYYEKGDYDNAMKYANEALALNKEDTQAPVMLAQCYRMKKDYAAALKTIEDAIVLFDGSRNEGEGLNIPNAHAALLSQRAILSLLDGNNTAKAVEDAKAATQAYGSLNEYSVLAIAYTAAGDKDGYNEVVAFLKENGAQLGDDIVQYYNGKKTLEDLLTGEGDF